ncbi:hypothetical protein MYSTI_01248 [Myxococcus stipitatus DSM 14675]|uniref:Lipoprotein n=1 Tax=Myxococcus stipitatus (strain DSM 14675 / JCM 12634 / Mx s8) TaxID=1278073 RepID=L7U1C8_MYXSD|nr:DUF6624 domain-containing protein [Myxococcus stipitatus]AGC42596.1 hypothetical protein MYSTI_01248 [Myxococcus stipitatus DSM 14675]
MRRLVVVLTALNLAACAHGGAAPESSEVGEVGAQKAPPLTAEATPEARKAASEAEGLARSGESAQALPLYRVAWEGGVRTKDLAYNAACAAALAKASDEALVWLRRAVEAGFDNAKHMKSDPDLVSIRELPGYAPLEQKAAAAEAKLYEAANPELRDELLRRMDEDQEARQALMASNFKDEAAQAKLREVDSRNTVWLKGIIAKVGWPGHEVVGVRGSFAAWLLVQHADQDVAFQSEVLPMLEKAVARGEGSAKNLAYLTDRVAVNTGKPQRYGTQLEEVNGRMVAKTLEDPAGVDERRKAVGLGTLEEYIQSFERMKAASQKP